MSASLQAQPLARPVGAAPFAQHRVVTLPGNTVTAVVRTADGRYAVGLAAPPQVCFFDAHGADTVLARLEAAPSSLTPRPDGAVIVTSNHGHTFAVAPDGTVRDATHWTAVRDASDWMPLGRGRFVRTAAQGRGTLLQVLSSRAYEAHTYDLPTLTPPTVPVRLDSARAVFFSGSRDTVVRPTLVRFDASGRWSTVPTLVGIQRVGSLGGHDGLALATDRALVLTDREGIPVHEVPLTPVTALFEAPDGVLATLGVTPPVMVRVTADGTVLSRATVPQGATAPLFDSDGAMLTVTGRGILAAYGPDGAERWRMNLGEEVLPPMVPRAEGGVLIATARNGVIVVE